MTSVSKVCDIPLAPFFGILIENIYFSERDNHGYPDSIPHHVWDFESFTNKREWEERIQELSTKIYSPSKFKAFHMTPATIKTKISIEVE